MEQATRKLQAMMQMHYGEEYRRKWQGFTPREMAEIWSRKFEIEGIHPTVVMKLGDRLDWEHPPTLPMVIDAAQKLQAEFAREMKARMDATALPAPADIADPDSPAVIAAREELRQFVNARRMPS